MEKDVNKNMVMSVEKEEEEQGKEDAGKEEDREAEEAAERNR